MIYKSNSGFGNKISKHWFDDHGLCYLDISRKIAGHELREPGLEPMDDSNVESKSDIDLDHLTHITDYRMEVEYFSGFKYLQILAWMVEPLA